VAPRLPELPSGKLDLAGVWSDVLGVAPKPGDTFEALGGDSLRALEVVAACGAAGLPVEPAWMTGATRLEDLRKRLGRTSSPVLTAAALRREVERLRGPRLPAPPEGPSREIFLTGATGFLGGRLLQELLARTDATIHCLVRGGAGRLPAYPRVRPVEGGLDARAWRGLEDRIDAVYHCAARVHVALPFEALHATNLRGVREVLRFAAAGRPKRFHYASTLSVFVSTDRDRGAMREDDDLSRTRRVYGGYAQTKWAAERLVREAGPAWIYRFGLLTGPGRPRDLLNLFLASIRAIGCAPRDGRALRVDVTPAGYAAAAMAAIALGAPPGTYHVANPRSLSLGDLARRLGLPEVGRREWRRRAGGSLADLALRRRLEGDGRRRDVDLFQATGARFRMQNTEAALAGRGLACPSPAEALEEILR
jgi:myxalamid-type nonribosomal peptide synthetase MxaA